MLPNIDLNYSFQKLKNTTMAQPFKHNFKTSFGLLDIPGVNGYTQALSAVQAHIAEVTQWKPENRYIDAVVILERITATMDELRPLMDKAETELNELTKNF